MTLSLPRVLKHQPLFALAAIAVVALGIALATTAASLIDALLFRSVPARDVHQLHRIESGLYNGITTAPAARDLMEGLAPLPVYAYTLTRNVEFSSGPGTATGLVSLAEFMGDAFGVLGWHAAQGRGLRAEDYLPGSEPVAVLSQQFWQRHFDGRDDLLGDSIRLNGVSYRVVGVLPPEFDRVNLLRSTEVFTTFIHTSEKWRYDHRNSHAHTLVARIDDPARVPELSARLVTLGDHLRRAYPDSDASPGYTLVPESEAAARELGDLAGKSRVIAGLIAALLLVACFNVGNMLLAHAYRREREFAIRQSFGATAGHLFRLMLGESMAIALLGGVVGAGASVLLVRLLRKLEFGADVNLTIDGTALLLGLGATVLMGVVSGLIPAAQMSFRSFGEHMKSGGRHTGGHRLAQGLIIGQVAFCATLLTVCSLFVASLRASLAFDTGMATDRILYAEIYMRAVEPADRPAVTRDLLARVRALPGVASAGMGLRPPLGGAGAARSRLVGVDASHDAESLPTRFGFGTPGYFETVGVPLVAGRDFAEEENEYPFTVAIINETMARSFWPDRTAHEVIEQQFIPWEQTRLRVVGIARDFALTPWVKPEPFFMIPHFESRLTLHVRAAGDPRTTVVTLDRLLRDPNNRFVAGPVGLFEQAQARAFLDVISTLRVIGVLAGAALLLSACGTWFMTRQFVRLRRKEMCIRLAVGAQPGGLLWRTVRHNLALAGVGLAVAGACSWWISGYLAPLIPGADGAAMHSYALVVLVTGIVVLVSSLIPALRVLRLQPREVLNEV